MQAESQRLEAASDLERLRLTSSADRAAIDHHFNQVVDEYHPSRFESHNPSILLLAIQIANLLRDARDRLLASVQPLATSTTPEASSAPLIPGAGPQSWAPPPMPIEAQLEQATRVALSWQQRAQQTEARMNEVEAALVEALGHHTTMSDRTVAAERALAEAHVQMEALDQARMDADTRARSLQAQLQDMQGQLQLAQASLDAANERASQPPPPPVARIVDETSDELRRRFDEALADAAEQRQHVAALGARVTELTDRLAAAETWSDDQETRRATADARSHQLDRHASTLNARIAELESAANAGPSEPAAASNPPNDAPPAELAEQLRRAVARADAAEAMAAMFEDEIGNEADGDERVRELEAELTTLGERLAAVELRASAAEHDRAELDLDVRSQIARAEIAESLLGMVDAPADIEPSHHEQWYDAARMQRALQTLLDGNGEQAIRAFRQLVALDPRDAAYRTLLALAEAYRTRERHSFDPSGFHEGHTVAGGSLEIPPLADDPTD